jgi:hypothetical protein
VHWRHLKQRRPDLVQSGSESTFPQSQCIAGPIQPDLGNVFPQEWKSAESFLVGDNQTKRGSECKAVHSEDKEKQKSTNQRWSPPIQRHDVEVTLDSNMQEMKLLLGQKHPVTSLACHPIHQSLMRRTDECNDSSSCNVKIKLKYITVPGGWKRTNGSPNQERSIDNRV